MLHNTMLVESHMLAWFQKLKQVFKEALENPALAGRMMHNNFMEDHLFSNDASILD